MKSIGKGIGASLLWGCSLAMALWRNGVAEWFLFAVLSCLFCFGLLIQLLSLRAVTVSRTLNKRETEIHAQEDIMVTLHISCRSYFPLFWLVITDRLQQSGAKMTKLQHAKLFFPWLRSNLTYSYRITALERGRYRFIETELKTGDLFGFFSKRKNVISNQSILVYPSRVPAAGWRIYNSLPSETSEAQRIAVVDVQQPLGAEIRDYMTGDPLNRIHWKSSAKQQRWQLRLPEHEGRAQIYVILDTSMVPAGTSKQGSHNTKSKAASTPDIAPRQARFETSIAWTVAMVQRWIVQGADVSFTYHADKPMTMKNVNLMMFPQLLAFLAEVEVESADRYEALIKCVQHAVLEVPKDAVIMVISERMDHTAAEIAQQISTKGPKLEWIWVMPSEVPSYEERTWVERLERVGGKVVPVKYRNFHLFAGQGGVEDAFA